MLAGRDPARSRNMFTNHLIVVVLALGGLTLADDPTKKPDAPKAEEATTKEVSRLAGAWTVLSVERDGEKADDAEIKEIRLEVKGDTRTLTRGGQAVMMSKYKLDVTKAPKHMDVTPADGPLAGQTLPGIYELKDDEMTVCLAFGGGDRPKEFKGGEGRLLQKFKRVKAEEKK
jgi:uncharacterized protein (TIGR03067 family)